MYAYAHRPHCACHFSPCAHALLSANMRVFEITSGRFHDHRSCEASLCSCQERPISIKSCGWWLFLLPWVWAMEPRILFSNWVLGFDVCGPVYADSRSNPWAGPASTHTGRMRERVTTWRCIQIPRASSSDNGLLKTKPNNQPTKQTTLHHKKATTR